MLGPSLLTMNRSGCHGDLLDNHSISYHEKNPDLRGPLCELKESIKRMKKLFKIIPKASIVNSNHDDLPYRKIRTAGVPSPYATDRHKVWGMPKGWTWEGDEYIIKGKNGIPDTHYHHGFRISAADHAEGLGMIHKAGHFHTAFKVEYRFARNSFVCGVNLGCLINRKHPAFEYDRNNKKRPVIGCGMSWGGFPVIVPMVLKRGGKWTRKLPFWLKS